MILQLHDNYLGARIDTSIETYTPQNAPTMQLWPPMSWDSYKPKTYADIENHYYNFSPGCASSWLNWAIEIYLYVVAAVVTFFTAGAGAPISAAIAGAAETVATFADDLVGEAIADILKKKIEDSIKTGIQTSIADAKQAALGSGRPRLDYGDEVDRIRDTYINNYPTPAYNLTYLETYTKSQLENKLDNFKDALQKSIDKCNKSECDRPGCRDAGVLTLRVQYVEMLLAAYEGTNTSTPEQYNRKISAEFYNALPKGQQKEVVEKVKDYEIKFRKDNDKKTAAIGGFLILGALFSGLLKKS